MDWLGVLLVALVSTVFVGLEAWLIAAMARRVIGFPVGWIRSLLVGLVTVGTLGSASTGLFTAWGLGDENGLTADPGVAVMFAILVAFWAFAVGVAVLVGLEIAFPTGSLPGPGTALFGWKARWRRTRRYSEILGIAARHGLASQLRGRGGYSEDRRTARALREALDEAGVAFVKLGQMLSTRQDLLPRVYISELAKLQTAAAPEEWQRIERAVEESLGRPLSEVFAHVDEEPLASASVAQVHRGRLMDGTSVVLKVQRPGAVRQVRQDTEIILRMARWMGRSVDWARRLGVERLAQGFAASLEEELDYGVELENMRVVAASFPDPDDDADGSFRLHVPKAYEELSSERLLVMDELPGQPLSRADAILAALTPERREAMAEDLLGVVLEQIISVGVFHADLHPGNIFVTAEGEVGLLDFGSVGRLDPQSRAAVGTLLYAIDKNDNVAAGDALIGLLERPEGLRERELERELGELMARYRTGFRGKGSQEMFASLLGLLLRHGFSVPAQVAAAFRALAAVEGSLVRISSGFDVVEAARRQGGGLLRRQLSGAGLREQLEQRALRLLPVVERMPRRLDRITEELEQGRFTMNVRMLADVRDRRFVTRLAQQIVVAILAGAATIGAIMLITGGGGPQLTPAVELNGFLGYALLFAGFVLGLRAVALVFRRDARADRDPED